MKSIVLANNKGGVGKTTSAVNLAGAFIRMNKRVLLVDMDPQGNSTSAYGAETEGEFTVFDLLMKECTAEQAVLEAPLGDIIPGDSMLNSVEHNLTSTPGGNMRLRKALRSIDNDYDICIIDTPPNIGVFMTSALIAADYVIVPVDASQFAMDGIGIIFSVIAQIREDVNENLKPLGLMLNRYDGRIKMDKDIMGQLHELKGSGYPVLLEYIRTDQSVKKAQAQQECLYDAYKNCNAVQDYKVLARSILEVI